MTVSTSSGSPSRTDGDRRRRVPLSEARPEIAAHWHPEKNAPLTAHDVVEKSRSFVWWVWPDGHECRMRVQDATRLDLRGNPWPCPVCQEVDRADRRYPADSLVADIPELVAAWVDPEPFGTMTLGDADRWYYKLQCPAGHRPKLHPSTFLILGCPHCRGAETKKTSPTVASAHPEMASQWHPTLNRQRPDEVTERSKKAIWWLADCCGHEWQMTVRDRYRPPKESDNAPGGRLAYRCPRCQSILGSLGFTDPDLAATWHPDNELTPFQVRPFSERLVTWLCPVNSEHTWLSTVSARSSGTGCPECSTAGTSGPEKALTAALCALGADAAPAKVARTVNGADWRVDALIVRGARRLVVEFDGSYWHQGKVHLDTTKTADLLASGHHVARVRSTPLPLLAITDDKLLQLPFHERLGDPANTAAAIWEWFTGLTRP